VCIGTNILEQLDVFSKIMDLEAVSYSEAFVCASLHGVFSLSSCHWFLARYIASK